MKTFRTAVERVPTMLNLRCSVAVIGIFFAAAGATGTGFLKAFRTKRFVVKMERAKLAADVARRILIQLQFSRRRSAFVGFGL